jgi:FlaA1/EpsC-like NDP-sugar epimerase
MRNIRKTVDTLLLVIWDIFAVAVSIVLGWGLKFGFSDKDLTVSYFSGLWEFFLLFSTVMILSNIVCRCYSNVWRHAGVSEYLRQTMAVMLSAAIILIMSAVFKFIYAELVVIMACLELLLVMAARASISFGYWLNSRIRAMKMRKKMKRVAIFGAGEAGANLVRKLIAHPEDDLLPVCFIDDNRTVWGRKICGIPVAGGRDRLPEVIESQEISEVIVAVSDIDHDTLKGLLVDCHKAHCHLSRFGAIDDVSESDLSHARITDINLEDLLRRDSVKLNMNVVKAFVEDKTVLVTGGAGSIGSEICRQVLAFGAKKLLIFDICENGLYEINNELRATFDPGRYELLLGSVRDTRRLHDVFTQYSPEVVFHAAAHKHVPMMEINPMEAVKNNVYGTANTAREAIAAGAEKFILISTDKAVNPTSVMGATKRIAEIMIQLFDKTGSTDFAAVRFGNVLGSSGSVVPFFKKQIAQGGPVTVTDRAMRRYFMTIPEAVQLVLEAGAMARGGEIFVLDMGKPVYIYDLACDLIRLSGYEPEKDIKIKITGLRPGEKLFEEIRLADEDVTKTSNNKIFICKPVDYDEEQIRGEIRGMWGCITQSDEPGVLRCIKQIVPTFSHADTGEKVNAGSAADEAAAGSQSAGLTGAERMV